MNYQSLILSATLALLPLTAAQAGVVVIHADQDATIGGGSNHSWNTAYRWVGDDGYGVYFALFGFDLGSLNGKKIKSIDFSAYHNFHITDAAVGASFGLDNTWKANEVVYYDALGDILDTRHASAATTHSYQTWKLGAPVTGGDRLTVALRGKGWNDYEPVSSAYGHAAYVSITTADVPEPASLALLGLGIAGLAAARRRKTA